MKIIIPACADEKLLIAKDEFIHFYSKATGIKLDFVTEDNNTETENLIVLGNCKKLVADNNVKVDFSLLGFNGFVIKTVGNNLFIIGGSRYGTVYGVYEFMRICFNYDFFAVGSYHIDFVGKEFIIPEIDLVKVPDIQQVMTNYGIYRRPQNKKEAIRFGYENWSEVFHYVDGNHPWHNFLSFVKPSIYNNPNEHPESYHPEYFTKNGICLSNPEVFDIVVEGMKKCLKKDTQVSNITFTHMDHGIFCECPKCLADRDKYGGLYSGNKVKFMNKLSRTLAPWIEKEFPGRKINFAFFSYENETRFGPSYKNEKGEYVPYDDEVVCDDNVAVFCCLDGNYKPHKSFYDSWERCVQARESVLSWKPIAKKMFFWAYEVNYYEFFPPVNTFNVMQKNWQFFKENNGEIVFSQGQIDTFNSTGFTMLKVYLQSKLRWDVNCDINIYIDKFFKHYFDVACEPMREYFDLLRLHFDWQETVMNSNKSNQVKESSLYWPFPALVTMKEAIDGAFEKILPLKISDPILYDKLYYRIKLEAVAIDYFFVDTHSSYFSDKELYERRFNFMKDLKYLEFTKWGEGTPVGRLYLDWGYPEWEHYMDEIMNGKKDD